MGNSPLVASDFFCTVGGITGKRVGRVGDSPLVGSGGLADNTMGGCSSTGHGESILYVTFR